MSDIPPTSHTALFLRLTCRTPSRTLRQLFTRSPSNPPTSDIPPASHTPVFLCLTCPRAHPGPPNRYLRSLKSNNGTSDVQCTSDLPTAYIRRNLDYKLCLTYDVPLFYVAWTGVPHLLLTYHNITLPITTRSTILDATRSSPEMNSANKQVRSTLAHPLRVVNIPPILNHKCQKTPIRSKLSMRTFRMKFSFPMTPGLHQKWKQLRKRQTCA